MGYKQLDFRKTMSNILGPVVDLIHGLTVHTGNVTHLFC
jgi:hypothetical protein